MKIRNFTGVSRENSGERQKNSKEHKKLEEAVYSCRNYFNGLRPMFIIITRFCTKNSEEIFQRYKPYVKYTSLRKGYVPSIMLINIMGYGLMAENENEMMAANLLEAMNKCFRKR